MKYRLWEPAKTTFKSGGEIRTQASKYNIQDKWLNLVNIIYYVKNYQEIWHAMHEYKYNVR